MPNFFQHRMFRNWKKWSVIFFATAVGAIAFQNCTRVELEEMQSQEKAAGIDAVGPQFATLKIGDDETLPPLKLIFVVDNSGTMGINQINLKSAFSKMFTGDNEKNLAPFDTTAYVISTSQASLKDGDSEFSRLPRRSPSSFNGANYLSFMSQYRGSSLDGSVAGDLVGYQLVATSDLSGSSLRYVPSPVADFTEASGLVHSQVEVRKPHGASVADFDTAFRKRIDILNPKLSAFDNTDHGVLDDVIDHESGLCALARMVKDNTYVHDGDIAAYIVVSDENDNDPAGRSCIDSIINSTSSDSYIDGRCEKPSTHLSYRSLLANPTHARCSVTYNNGFNYTFKYQMPSTNVTYYTKSMSYDLQQTYVSFYTYTQTYYQKRTGVSYETSQQTFNRVSTPVDFYTKAPTYEIPQTQVTYSVKSERCQIRDGAKVNCTDVFTPGSTNLAGRAGNDCVAFVGGRLPQGTVLDTSANGVKCSPADSIAKSGACSTTETSIENCKQNYAPAPRASLAGSLGTASCASFVAGKLGNGAVYTDEGHLPTCGDKVVASPTTGACSTSDTTIENCTTSYNRVATAITLDGIQGNQSCPDFSRGRLPGDNVVYDVSGHQPQCVSAQSEPRQGNCSTTDSNVSNCQNVYSAPQEVLLQGIPASGQSYENFANAAGVLPGNAARGDANHPVTGRSGPVKSGIAGNCKSTDLGVLNCLATYTQASTPANLQGTPAAGQSCPAFVNHSIANAVYDDTNHDFSCSSGPTLAREVSGSDSFANWRSFNAQVNGDCSTELASNIQTTRNLQVSSVTSCKITSLSSGNPQVLSDPNQDLPCSVANWQAVCDSSNGAFHNCSKTDVAAGDPYDTNRSNQDLPGIVTCQTQCSDTIFCKDKSGTLADNFHDCQASGPNYAEASKFTMQSASKTNLCPSGQRQVTTNGPYQSHGTKTNYVAGSLSETSTPNALAQFIKDRSNAIFKSNLASVAMFVRQHSDPLGVNGSFGDAYNAFAQMMGGRSQSVLSDAAGYASSLQDLSGEIRKRLDRSFKIKQIQEGQQVRQVWLIRQGQGTNVNPLDTSLWTASAGTLTLAPTVAFEFGDEIKVEYY